MFARLGRVFDGRILRCIRARCRRRSDEKGSVHGDHVAGIALRRGRQRHDARRQRSRGLMQGRQSLSRVSQPAGARGSAETIGLVREAQRLLRIEFGDNPMKRFLVTLLMIPALSATSFAAEISILSAGAVETGLQAFAPVVKRETGNDIKTQFNTTPQIAQRIAAGEAFDIVIAPPDAIAKAAKDGKVVAETQVPVGRVGGGVVVRNGASAPDISSVDALKRALLAADSVVYNTASSGIYLDKLFEKMGILEQLKPKTTRYPGGSEVMAHVSKGKGNEIGFGAITEIKAYEPKGVRLVGPLPTDVQNYTSYDAVMMTGTTSPDAAKAVLKQIATAAGKAAFTSNGVE
ncbi:MAG: ABC transporter substrate-binding protein [Betaproteobacteria bacterium]|nr:MAG: ABC transporter substrate-binding protein [Betaproteobacteria bacterium]